MRVQNVKVKVSFEKPFTKLLIPPPQVTNKLQEFGDTSPPFEERNTLIREYAKSGFAERAVVVLKGKPAIYYNSPFNWGIITNANATRDAGKPWAPFTVKWMTRTETSKHHPDELVLIHESLSENEMYMRYNGWDDEKDC